MSCLYFGLDPSHFESEYPIEHIPLIKIVPKASNCLELESMKRDFSKYTHIIFTSKIAVKVFFSRMDVSLQDKCVIAIGQITAFHLRTFGVKPDFVADEETQEGVIELLQGIDLEGAHLLLPRSSRARAALVHFLVESGVRHTICNLYDTEFRLQKVLFEGARQMVFTSPSVVDSYFAQFQGVPSGVELIAIGPITKKSLQSHLDSCCNACQTVGGDNDSSTRTTRS